MVAVIQNLNYQLKKSQTAQPAATFSHIGTTCSKEPVQQLWMP